MSRVAFAAAAIGIFVTPAVALAQTPVPLTQPPVAVVQSVAQPLVAHVHINVANNTSVSQTVSGTNVAPFELGPYQRAVLDTNVMPIPAPTVPGSTVPVQFNYSVGQNFGPSCHGSIDMALQSRGPSPGMYNVTNCVAHSLATSGANCQIDVNARHAACEGGLSLSMQ